MGKSPIYQKIGNALANNTFDLRTNTEEWPNINYYWGKKRSKEDARDESEIRDTVRAQAGLKG